MSVNKAAKIASALMGNAFRTHSISKAGANNRTFRLSDGASDLLLKMYFPDPNGSFTRCRREFAFTTFARDRGITSVPQPVAAAPLLGAAIFEYVEGRAVSRKDISGKLVRTAADFVAALNRHRSHPAASRLRDGAEAAFSVRRHLAITQQRIARLSELSRHAELSRFLAKDLIPAWKAIRTHVLSHGPLPVREKILSPSDFGFHNALIEKSGGVRFIDFEYAGWDDPAKMACDFFCQPQIPVSMDFFEAFVAAAFQGLREKNAAIDRARLLLPVYRVKWCCILLNEFLPEGIRRRRFAGQAADIRSIRSRQLEKSRKYLHGHVSSL